MTVVSTNQNPDALTFTIVSEFAAPPARVWQIWSDPRQLERWWGPPTYPATFTDHDLVAGGSASYYMTGPEGDKAAGWWRILAVDEPRFIEFEDGFADETGAPNDKMPTTRARVELEATGSGTRMTVTTTFGSVDEMQQLIDMGMDEGATLAMGQIDAILAA
jgi:uncharacterized protein YndB with AHSA1/START domain